jgi:hypothetical protein
MRDTQASNPTRRLTRVWVVYYIWFGSLLDMMVQGPQLCTLPPTRRLLAATMYKQIVMSVF